MTFIILVSLILLVRRDRNSWFAASLTSVPDWYPHHVFVLVHVVLEPDYRRDELGVRGGRCCLRAELLGQETGVHVLSDRTGTLPLFLACYCSSCSLGMRVTLLFASGQYNMIISYREPPWILAKVDGAFFSLYTKLKAFFSCIARKYWREANSFDIESLSLFPLPQVNHAVSYLGLCRTRMVTECMLCRSRGG